jgi:hypothetical protein
MSSSWGACADPEGSNLPRHDAVVDAAEQLIASLLRSGRMSPAAAFRLSDLLIESGDVEGGIGLIKIGQDLLDVPQRERCGIEPDVSYEDDIVY